MTPTFGPTLSTILSISVAHNNFEDDLFGNSNFNHHNHFRGASSPDYSNFNSNVVLSSSSSSSSPSSSFSTTPITNTNTTTTPNMLQHPALSRRSSESIVDTAPYFRKQPVRRYTLPSIMNSWSNSTGQDHNNSTAVPQSPDTNSRFWEIGNRGDSSVQVAMEQVQFGL